MRTETKTTTSVVRIPAKIVIKGNENGDAVKSHPTSASPGDGDINTGSGGYVYGSLNASCKLSGKYARIEFTYNVWTSDYGKSAKGDHLTINTSRLVDLSSYDSAPSPWTYISNKGEKVTVKERFTYSLRTHSDAYYIDYYKAKDSRRGWLKVDNSYPQSNKPQTWIPRENLRFKIDDSGSELTKAGNIGFEALVYISILVTHTTEKTFQDPINDVAQAVASKDKALSSLTLDGLLNNRPITTLEDGLKSFATIAVHDDGGIGAWLRGQRDEQLGIQTYTFPHSLTNKAPSTDYYLGSIILVDNNFRTHHPSKVVFSESERKRLSMYATNNRTNHYFDNVLPTAKEMNNKKNEFIEKYIGRVSSSTQLPSITTIDFQDFESTDGISIGGSVKGVDFGFSSGDRTKKVRVFTFKQVLFSLNLDDTYKKGSDFFSDKINVSQFKNSIQHYSPAIISTVYYGKVAHLAVVSTDQSAMSVNISKTDFFNGNAKITGSTKNCSFKAIVLGGTAGAMNGTINFSDLNDANSFLKSIMKEMTALDAEAAIPIEFEAKYLRNPAQKVTTNIYKYFTRYIDKIKLNIREDNKGISASARLRLLDYVYDNKGKADYQFKYWNKGLDYTVEVSPWACCIEVKMDVVGGEYCDYNVFVPYIPLSSLTQDSNGDWVFRIGNNGSTLKDVKNNATVTPTVPGCYVCKSNEYYRGDLKESQYLGRTEDQVLTDYFNYCEEKYATASPFYRLSSLKKIKSTRGND